jgi:hypothetical protein
MEVNNMDTQRKFEVGDKVILKAGTRFTRANEGSIFKLEENREATFLKYGGTNWAGKERVLVELQPISPQYYPHKIWVGLVDALTIDDAQTLYMMDIKNVAKLIRKELKEKFPKQTFSVRLERYSMGESIDIRWTDGVAIKKVEPVAQKYEHIDRDQYSGEILSGGNRYVQCHRRYSDDIPAKVEQEIRNKFTKDSFKEGYDPHLQTLVWQQMSSSDY